MKTFKTATFAAALLGSAAAFAQTPASPAEMPAGTQAGEWPEFTALDANGDGHVSKDEARANATLSARFSELDENKDGSISDTEYAYAKNKGPGSSTTEPKSTTEPSTTEPQSTTPAPTPNDPADATPPIDPNNPNNRM